MLAISNQLMIRMRLSRLSNSYSSLRRFITRKYCFLHLAKESRYVAESPIEPARTERFERESERTGKSGDGEREKRPIVRSMREEIGDSISTQMSRGQIFPGSGLWGLGCPWDAASGDSLPNKTRETERKR